MSKLSRNKKKKLRLKPKGFDYLKDGQGYEREDKEVPKELHKVRNADYGKIKLKFGDFWNILKAGLRKQALIQLGYEESSIGKIRTIAFVVLGCLGVILALVIISLFN